jgi:hypothetical protein
MTYDDQLAELNNPDELKWSAAHDLVAAPDLLPNPEAAQLRTSGRCLPLGWRVIAEAGRDHRIQHHLVPLPSFDLYPRIREHVLQNGGQSSDLFRSNPFTPPLQAGRNVAVDDNLRNARHSVEPFASHCEQRRRQRASAQLVLDLPQDRVRIVQGVEKDLLGLSRLDNGRSRRLGLRE